MPNKHDELQVLLQDILSTFKAQFIEGVSEFEIITQLKKPPYSLFDDNALRDPLMLFQTHFVLFHSLYHLRNEWRAQSIGELNIGATLIKLQPTLSFDAALQVADPLGDYYLDWNNFSATDEAGVEDLLNRFWQAMAGGDMQYCVSQEALNEASFALQIDSLEGLSLIQLKQQYRKLQHANHPDKGGSVEDSQRVLQAYTTLHKYISNKQSQ
ncbi:DNA-J related domain-containing protein [Brumicola nitratireducens]|uniref:DnaJ-related protein n=1 Tax=Glaciecola nitratireducens (strain JCM 12485 / KCTC 12276 / FR1064) TaxID=1085623 RepID=G4QE68_GLANF|nr:DNA-J related domain-containing protein [Glaciecola nitratireducens]AEP31342.1 DnaJ-related protein [Glaciecola nitratireducens FR1064]